MPISSTSHYLPYALGASAPTVMRPPPTRPIALHDSPARHIWGTGVTPRTPEATMAQSNSYDELPPNLAPYAMRYAEARALRSSQGLTRQWSAMIPPRYSEPTLPTSASLQNLRQVHATDFHQRSLSYGNGAAYVMHGATRSASSASGEATSVLSASGARWSAADSASRHSPSWLLLKDRPAGLPRASKPAGFHADVANKLRDTSAFEYVRHFR